MKEDFPKITISGTSEPIKAYSIDLSGGGQEQSKLKISFISNSSVSYEPDSTKLITVTIGNFYTFKGYIVSVSNRESVASGRTTELSLIDSSIILDKLWVGLKGKYGPPQAYSRPAQNKGNTINLNNLSKVVNFTSVNSNANDNLNSLYIFETHGSFPSNLILVGEAIDPCAKLQSEAYFDPCDPCSTQQKYLSLDDCQKNRDFQILDVDYTFSDLISAARSKDVFFGATFSDILNYRAQYVGTLREVLNQWCEDYGYSFYWDGEKVVFVNLASGININDGNLLSSEKCKVEDISTTKSIEGNVKNINIAYFGKNGEIKEYDCLSRQASKQEQAIGIILQPISLKKLASSYRDNALYGGSKLGGKTTSTTSINNFMTCAMLQHYNYYDIRNDFVWLNIYGNTDASDIALGNFPLMGQVFAVAHAETTESQSGFYNTQLLRRLFNVLKNSQSSFAIDMDYILFTSKRFDDNYYWNVEKVISDVAGKTWYKTTNQNGANYTYTHPDGNLKIFEGQKTDGNINQNQFIINLSDINFNNLPWEDFEDTKADLTRESGIHLILEREPLWESNYIADPTKSVRSLLSFIIDSDITDEVQAFGVQVPAGFKAMACRNKDKLDTAITKKTSRLERDRRQYGRSGLTSNSCPQLRFSFPLNDGKKYTINITSPVDSSYRLERQEDSASLEKPPVKAIIPKLEMIIIGASDSINDKNYIASNITYKDITDNYLSKQTQIGNRCFVDRSKVFSYGNEIIKDLYNSSPKVKETKTYTILGVPDSNFSPEDGLSSFSIRLDSSGTKTLLNFSNTLPKMKSENVIKKQLEYLLKKQINRSYINNILQ